MTANGAVLFMLAIAAAAIAAPGGRGLAIIGLLAAVFAAVELHARAFVALRRALLLVLPLAAFMALVWVVVVGRAPAEIAAGVAGTREAALVHVALVCARLSVIVFVLQALVLRFAAVTPLAFVQALYLPVPAKRLMALTLSLVETLAHAVERAHTALIAAGALTRRASLRNLRNGFLLVQTVWLTAVTIVLGRMRDKWPIENTLARLDALLAATPARPFGHLDHVWVPIALGTGIVALVV